MAEKNVRVLKDLLTKVVKAKEGLADTEEGDSKTERSDELIPLQISPQAAITKPKMERLFPNVYGKKRTSSTTTHTKFSSKKKCGSSLEKGENRHKEVSLFGG